MEYLYEKSSEWEQLVNKQNHSDELLQQVCIEERRELKDLSKLPEFVNDPYAKGTFVYKFKKRAILLQSKFTYCIALSIFEKLNPDDFVIKINDTEIVFNEYTLIHILSRHFAETIKPYNTGKTFINSDFKPRLLSKQIKVIVTKIDKSKFLKKSPIDKIAFRHREVDYLLFTNIKVKHVKGKGAVNFRRIDTFFPVEDAILKDKFFGKYTLRKIDNETSVYAP